MILFFGTRKGKRNTKKLRDVSCPYCQQSNTLSIEETSNYFHLFWVKIVKISNNTIAECSHCKRVYYSEEFTREMKIAASE